MSLRVIKHIITDADPSSVSYSGKDASFYVAQELFGSALALFFLNYSSGAAINLAGGFGPSAMFYDVRQIR